MRGRTTWLSLGAAGAGVIAALVVGLWAGRLDERYTSRATIAVQQPFLVRPSEPELHLATRYFAVRDAPGTSSLVDHPPPARGIARRVAAGLPWIDEHQVLHQVTVTPYHPKSQLTFSVWAGTAAHAATLANRYAEEYRQYDREIYRSRVTEALETLRIEAAIARYAGRRERYEALRGRLAQLRVLQRLEPRALTIVARARVPRSASAPRPVRDAVVVLLIGLSLALLAVGSGPRRASGGNAGVGR